VAAHLEPEFLVIDEVLAVGDTEFQNKCLGKMSEVAEGGRTVLFVSHNLRAVQNLCNRSLLLRKGEIFQDGKTYDVITEYLSHVMEKTTIPLSERSDRTGDGRFRFIELAFKTRSANVIRCGEEVEIVIKYDINKKIKNAEISLFFFDTTGTRVLYLGNKVAGASFDELPENMKVVFSFKKFPLLPGKYTLSLNCVVNGSQADGIREAATIVVAEGDFYGSGRLPPGGNGFVAVEQKWEIVNGE
jgi:lipopolysaccharide transport system ATP-binding protein